MSIQNKGEKPKIDRATNFSFYLISSSLIAALLLLIGFVVLGLF